MTEIVLKQTSPEGQELRATFLPEKGMNLISYKKGSIEIIDQSTRPLFEERCAGLGALIGPHFHRRQPAALPKILLDHTHPEIEQLRKVDPSLDPFSHGVGRYAAWSYEQIGNSITATLKGSDTWNGIPLKDLEGQDFKMKYYAKMESTGLHLELSVVSENDALVGIHYYYQLPKKQGTIKSQVKDHYLFQGKRESISPNWNYNRDSQTLIFPLDRECDFTFRPASDPTQGNILLDTLEYQLTTRFESNSEECSWQLWHPQDASFVCIEPVSSQDPRHPNLTVSSIKIHLEIMNPLLKELIP